MKCANPQCPHVFQNIGERVLVKIDSEIAETKTIALCAVCAQDLNEWRNEM